MALALTAQWRCGCGRAITTPVTGTSSSFFAVTFELEFPTAIEDEEASCRNTQMSAAGESGAGARLGGAAANIADLAAVDFG